VLKKELEDRIAALGRYGSWPEIIADLDSLTETEIEQDGKRFIVRSAPEALLATLTGLSALSIGHSSVSRGKPSRRFEVCSRHRSDRYPISRWSEPDPHVFRCRRGSGGHRAIMRQ
jgi:hypothetical protein